MLKSLYVVLIAGLIAFSTSPVSAADVAPEAVVGAETIDVAKAKALHEQEALFVDLRMEEDFNKGHIPGAESMNIAGAFNKDAFELLADQDQIVVFYCYGTGCMRSYTASTRAVGWGYTNIKYFRTGMPAWKEAGHSIESQM
ncbi:Rhodanese domain protein [Candidatus Terasakiella magnetica]|uniref:Rhodanese domain protein n=1 Tax=Candidatus Terasakiella magnetica TaxID=1867952 RepID=A0A1C3RK57_9PROT|nr:rhodanese-like domain-containing protein [Candidatus Terasakiella magnetica]SCA57672.1 Rhodanese domain protein [Candidatus Terasakiella magnetica]